VDDCTFWYTQEYIPSNGSFQLANAHWRVQVPGLRWIADAHTGRRPERDADTDTDTNATPTPNSDTGSC